MSQSYPVMEAQQPVVTEFGDGNPIAFSPNGYALHDLGKLLGKREPQYDEGEVTLHDIPSLLNYLNRFAGEGKTDITNAVLYVDSVNLTITAILDDMVFADVKMGRRVHRSKLAIKLDPKFMLWKDFCAKPQTQKDFIRFIELNESHFKKPSGAEMRSLAAQLEVKKSTKFTNIERTKGAARDYTLEYRTETEQMGEVVFPSDVFITIPVFHHQSKGDVPVKLLFDLRDNEVVFTLRIPDAAAIVDAAWEQIFKELQEGTAAAKLDVPILRGVAPEPPKS